MATLFQSVVQCNLGSKIPFLGCPQICTTIGNDELDNLSQNRIGHHGRQLFSLLSFTGMSCFWRACRSTRKQCHRRAGLSEKNQHPTDYYGLLGLPRFDGTAEEVRTAHRRLVKMVHPDVIGPTANDLIELVNAAYRTLSDPTLRSTYDGQLREHTLNVARGNSMVCARHSSWSPDAPINASGIFVDETLCVACNYCVDGAPSTFQIDREGSGRARVVCQYGDAADDVHWAMQSCPTEAISYVSREDLYDLEQLMPQCEIQSPDSLMAGLADYVPGPPGPFQLLEEMRAHDNSQQASPRDALSPSDRSNANAALAHKIQDAVEHLPSSVLIAAWPEEGNEVHQ